MRQLYREEYICPGPSTVSFRGVHGVGKRGDVMCVSKCLEKADCSCKAYLRQVEKIERYEERFHRVR